MKYKLAQSVGLQEPQDGYTPEEEVLEKLIADATIQSLYAKLPTSRMKFIVAACFDCGYPQETVADILGVTQARIAQEVDMIRRILLGHKYKATGKRPKKISQETIEKVAYFLELP